jgi:MFS transporter, OPA family, glycerol-3-phosphate transporter
MVLAGLSLLATAAVMLVGLWHIDNLWVMRGYFFLIGVFLYGPDSMVSATAAIDFGTKRVGVAVSDWASVRET